MFRKRNGATGSMDESHSDLAGEHLTAEARQARTAGLPEEERRSLEAAAWLARRRSSLDPRPGYISASRRRLVAQLQESRPARAGLPVAKPARSFTSRLLQNAFARAVLVVLLVMVLAANTNSISASAKAAFPGDVFYPVKIVSEDIQLGFSFDPAVDAQLHTRFAQRRLGDQAALILEGRFDQLPGTAENGVSQIQAAVQMTLQVAERDPLAARILAASLEDTVFNQTEVLSLLSVAVPEGYVWTIEIVMQAAADGRDALSKLQD